MRMPAFFTKQITDFFESLLLVQALCDKEADLAGSIYFDFRTKYQQIPLYKVPF